MKNSIRNKVLLIGNVGKDPIISNLENGKKVARFSLATNANYRNEKGEKVTTAEWHNLVGWGNVADIVEKFVVKGKEIAIDGKLKTRTYTTDDGNERYVSEVVISEILLLGKHEKTI